MGTPLDLTVMTVSSAFGTGATIPLSGAATVGGVSFLTFTLAGASTAAAGTTVDYSILDVGASEIGTATFISSANTLSSRTPTKSTNGNSAITASSAALVYGTIRAESLTPFITAGQLLGTATNNSANAGNVGEVISSTIPATSAVSLVSANPKTIATISLTAGDWDARGVIYFNPAGTTTITQALAGISQTTNVLAGPVTSGAEGLSGINAVLATGTPQFIPVGVTQQLLSGTTNIFLVAQAAFGVSTMSAFGTILARRVR